jgi:drug/metabolite transporter (DMT)-like permease
MLNKQAFKGVLLLGIAAVLFASTTVFAKYAAQLGQVSGLVTSFARFLIGFLIAGGYVWYSKRSIRPVSRNNVILRSIFNILSATFFFLGIEYTTITNANLLNMTSPVYIFLLAPLFAGYHAKPRSYLLFLLFCVAGIYLVVFPDFSHINLGDIYAALSGLFGGIAISFLHQARKTDAAHVILFYQMGLGTLLSFSIAATVYIPMNGLVWLLLLACGLSGAVAQVLLTWGYRFIDARSGSIVSASQILFAALLGVLLFQDPLTWRVALGGLFIVISLLGVSEVWRLLLPKNTGSQRLYS